MKSRTLIISIFSAIALLFSAAATAQQDQSAQQGHSMQSAQPAPVDVSDTQLEQFVDAQAGISTIQQDFSQRLEGIEDPEQAHELQTQANEEMIAAVESAGLDVESFNAIAMAIQNDPELQQKLTQMIQDRS